MSQPLYDTFYSQTENIPLSSDEKKDFMQKIQKVKEYDLFYLLIRSHTRKEGVDERYPYKLRQLKKGIKVNLEELPPRLQQILYKFLNVYLEKEIACPQASF